jgi:hypothetical protein
MADVRKQLTFDGQAISWNGLQYAMNEAGLAKDRTLAELLRLVPFDGSDYTKAVLPFSTQSPQAAPSNEPLIAPGLAANPIAINQFTAIVGSRTNVGGPSSDPVDSAPALNWRDLRTQFQSPSFLVSSSNFPSNSSGHNRYDLLYVAMTIDTSSNITQLVKPATSGAAAPQTVLGDITTTLTYGVVTGTAASVPTAPSAPADVPASGIFYIPLALIIVPNGFTSGSSTFATKQIATTAPVVSFSQAMGCPTLGPASGYTGGNIATVSLSSDGGSNWGSTASRPSVALPPTMVGGASRFILFDGTQTNANTYPIKNTNSVDTSIDWRNRFFRVMVSTTGAFKLAPDPTYSSGGATPSAEAYVGGPSGTPTVSGVLVAMGQSLRPDSGAVTSSIISGAGMVLYLTPTNLGLGASSYIGLYVPLSGGNAGNLVLLYSNAAADVYAAIWLDATGPFDNV